MRFNATILRCGLAAVMATGLCGLRASWAQEATDDLFGSGAEQPGTQTKTIESSRGGYGDSGGGYGENPMMVGGYGMGRSGDPVADRQRQFLMQAVNKAVAALRAAEGEDAKAKATAQLSEAFDKYFEDDMKRRAAELAKIEARVKKLRSQLEKRAANKQEIINLQIKVLENEADGLGLFSQAPSPALRDSMPSIGTPTRISGGAQSISDPADDLFGNPSSNGPPKSGAATTVNETSR